MKKLKIVIAPDSFKESIDAFKASEAIKEGFIKVFPEAEYEVIPMADGGEGTSEVIIDALNGEFINANVTGPLGNIIESKFGYINKECKAVIEVAAACGLALVPQEKRNPLKTTSFGVGEMILKALDKGAKHILIGLGGSSTNDGGLGMLLALGAKAYDNDGNAIGGYGKELININTIDLTSIDKRIYEVNIEVACDVENPLIGENGATYTFGPQKGATTQIMEELELGMKNYSNIIKASTGIDIGNTPKAGAAGGLGAAFMLIGGNLKKGIDIVLENIKFEERIQNADYIITGEGSIDSQTKYGKTIAGIAKMSKSKNIPVIVEAGKVSDDISELYEMGVTAVFGIVDEPKTLEEALLNGYNALRKASENIARLLVVKKN
ncbi:glycerate kinase family protein [Clostridium sp. 'White wine YQ']|uniref:glycerate kinase family protein n=1 Tax=Clostridium sp. 'White wine YQ' TaxID=3027474 RepID=UPI002365E43A|nr:glycerate kinase [Clostridium sp. 'White wine YQ']MDD7794693.1 glycerate kinase [Clostridium sp. 'White wine YQ']